MKTLLLSLLICFVISCKNEKSSALYTYNLQPTGTVKSFILDSDVRYNAFYLYMFDENNKEYLSFLNYRTNQILFYDFGTCEFLFKLNLHTEGPDGVAQVTGFYIKDFNNIYVSTYAYSGLLKVDTTNRIIQKIPYETTSTGYQVLPSYSPSSHPYIAPVFIDDKIYITQNALERFHPLDDTPLSVMIDTVQKNSESVPLTYGILTNKEWQSNDVMFSRIFNGKEFVYSFYVDEDIIVASINHSDIRRIKVKSKYVDNPAEKQEDSEKGPQLNLELARYGDLIYDSYREVYYRFVYPKTTLNDHINWWGKSVYGRKKFSVIILNKNFQIIGETLFPESIYNSYVFFVHKDGLYISRDYQMLNDQSEDYMTFELFNLVDKK